jgi:hypothetical protein
MPLSIPRLAFDADTSMLVWSSDVAILATRTVVANLSTEATIRGPVPAQREFERSKAIPNRCPRLYPAARDASGPASRPA